MPDGEGAPGSGGRASGRRGPLAALAAAARANPRLAVGLATALAMIAALALVIALFGSHPRSQLPPRPTPPASPGR